MHDQQQRFSHVVTSQQSCSVRCGEGRNMDMRLARRLVRCYFWTPSPTSAHLSCHACIRTEASGRAGLSCQPPPPPTNSTTNNYQTGQSETNARLGGPPELRTKLYAQCERAGPGGSVELSQAGERDKRERKDPPGQAVPVPVPRPKGRRPRLRRFYSRMVEKIYREVVVAQGRQDKERHDNHHTYLPTHGQQPT